MAQQDSWLKPGSADPGQELEGTRAQRSLTEVWPRRAVTGPGPGKLCRVTSQLQAEASFPNKGLHLRPSAALGERAGTGGAVPTDGI